MKITHLLIYLCAALLVLTVAGCYPHVSQAPITVTATAPKEIRLPVPVTGEIKFPVTVQLQNHSAQHLELFASTPCSVFDWVVMSGESEIQGKPNGLCAQVVATEVLFAGRELRTVQQIMLQAERYIAGQYRLRYTFWNHAGYVDFTATDAK